MRAAKMFFVGYLAVHTGVSAWFGWRGDWFAWRMFATSGRPPNVRIRYASGYEESWKSFRHRTGLGTMYRPEAARARFLVPYLCEHAGAVSIGVGTERYPCRH